MRKILLVIAAVILLPTNVKSQNDYYISPGIRLSWGGNSTIILGWKVSFGFMHSENYSEKCYYNITFGKQDVIYSKNSTTDRDLTYWEIQRGDYYGYYPLSAGGGLGISIIKDKVDPKLSLFAGGLLFTHFNYTFTRNLFDIGGELVIPYPFDEDNRDIGAG